MTTKMTRRTFLKGAAAAAAAVSLSGLLTGCGGDQELPDNAVQLGVFNVSIYGLNVDQGAELGTLKDVLETGANDVYVVAMKDGKELMLPAIGDCILNVDLGQGRMEVHVLEGLMDL